MQTKATHFCLKKYNNSNKQKKLCYKIHTCLGVFYT